MPLLCLFLLGVALASAQAPPAYKLVRSDEDWSFLRQPTTAPDLFDPLKYIPLRRNHPDSFLTLGGEVREMVERIENDNWTNSPYPVNSYLLQRFHFIADTHVNSNLRFFVQLKSNWQNGRAGGPRPIDQDKLDFLQAFFDLSWGTKDHGVTLRIGRQELHYGSGRLVEVREGPSVRQSFDGVRLLTHWNLWKVDLFATRPDTDSGGVFDNQPAHGTSFWGVYATRPFRPNSRRALDFYYLGLDRKRVAYNQGANREQRHSLGARFSQTPDAKARATFDHDIEAVYQFGSFGPGNIRAWTLASETGFTLPQMKLRPRLSLRADVSSGDKDPKDHNLQTFNALFPIGNYFGVIATTGPGPVNFMDLHPRLSVQLPHGVSVFGDWVFQWRQSLEDGVYAVPGFLLVPGGRSQARFVGHRPGLEVRWQIDRHAYLQVDYGIFYAGRFLRESGRPQNLGYFALMAGYKF